MDCERRPCAVRDRCGSTDSAVSDASENVFNLACARLRVDRFHRCDPSECAIRPLEPSPRTFGIAEMIAGDRDQASKSVKPVRFVARQFAAPSAALQAPG